MNPSKKEVPVFNPGDAEYRWKLWVTMRATSGKFRHFFWKRIFIFIAVLSVIGWVGATSAIWANLKVRRGFEEVRYVDLALPWRWPRYMTAMSEHYVAMGNDALRRGGADSAYYFYNAALALRPRDPQIVRLCSVAQFSMGARPIALANLATGLPAAVAAGDEAYVRQYFRMAFDLQADDDAYAAGKGVLPVQPDQVHLHKLIAFDMATSRFNRNDYAAAEKLLADWKLRSEPEGAMLFDQCLWESGRQESAVADLRDSLRRFGRRDVTYAALEQIAHTVHATETQLNYAVLRQLGDPEHPGPQLNLLYAYRVCGRTAPERAAVDAYIAKFAADPGALAGLLQYSTDAGDAKLAARLRDLAEPKGPVQPGYLYAVAEAAVVGHNWNAAGDALSELRKENAPMSRTFQASVVGLEMLTKFGRGDSTAGVFFTNFLSSVAALRSAEVLQEARVLQSLDQPDLAHQLLSKAFATLADSEPFLIELVCADLAAKERPQLADHLAPLVKKRKVPREVLEPALAFLTAPADEPLRSAITALLAKAPPRYLTTQRWP